MSKMKSGIIFINLGTPSKPTPAGVRTFLRKFLSDRRVVEVPGLLWLLILYLVILPFRSPRAAKGYQKIWMNDISPLRYFSQRLVVGIAEQLKKDYPSQQLEVRLAMTYGEPLIA
ncbi:MAG: ferrochelatase [Zhongshania sp.]|jgi:ferrochelatase